MYEKSYMHRDVVTHALITPCGTDFLATASRDGHLKFWKKMPEGIEFVKHYHSHLEPIHDLAVRVNSDSLPSAPSRALSVVSYSRIKLKIFHVVLFAPVFRSIYL